MADDHPSVEAWLRGEAPESPPPRELVNAFEAWSRRENIQPSPQEVIDFMRYLGGENIQPLPRKLIEAIAQRLRNEGLEADVQDIDRLIAQARIAYEWSTNWASTDAMPTIAGVHKAAVEFADRVQNVGQTLIENKHMTGWLDAFMRDHNVNESIVDLVHKLTLAAVGFERYIDDAKQQGSEIMVAAADGREHVHEHKRRTRTAARDRVLIPALVDVLKSLGLLLRAQDDTPWNPEALDAACEIVERVLTALDIDAPSAGNTSRSRGGEAGEGRLRKEIKLAWRALDK